MLNGAVSKAAIFVILSLAGVSFGLQSQFDMILSRFIGVESVMSVSFWNSLFCSLNHSTKRADCFNTKFQFVQFGLQTAGMNINYWYVKLSDQLITNQPFFSTLPSACLANLPFEGSCVLACEGHGQPPNSVLWYSIITSWISWLEFITNGP